MKRRLAVVPVVLVAAWMGAGRGGPVEVREAQAEAEAAPSNEELLARIEALETLAPDQAPIMADVGYHFGNLWFAGRAENWPLAEFYLAETGSHLRWAVRRIPIRKDAAGLEVNLGNIPEAFENSELAALKQAVAAHDGPGFERAYRQGLTACYTCHKASDKPYLRPRVPERPEAEILEFDPKADWPR
jgi:cytochrome c553